MIAKYVNALVQYGSWTYDIIFIEGDDIIFRVNTTFEQHPTSQDYTDRVNMYLTQIDSNYTLDTIEEP